MIVDVATPAAVAKQLRQSLDRHEVSHEACASWLGVSRQLVTRWCSAKDELTIDVRRLLALPPAVRRDLVSWLAGVDNAVVVERVGLSDDGETHAELTLDVLASSTRAASHAATIRQVITPMDAEQGAKLCTEVERAVGRLRMRYEHALAQRGTRVRPGLRRSRPPTRQEAEVA